MRKDLAIGKIGEENFIKILKKGRVKAKSNEKKEDRSFYDIKAEISGKDFTVEVKNDLYAAKMLAASQSMDIDQWKMNIDIQRGDPSRVYEGKNFKLKKTN